jgi:hypothetical protein
MGSPGCAEAGLARCGQITPCSPKSHNVRAGHIVTAGTGEQRRPVPLTAALRQALAEAGGSLPVWLIRLSLKTPVHASQRELAATVDVPGAILTPPPQRDGGGGLA